MKSPLQQILRYVVSLALMASFLYWAFKDIDADALWAAMNEASILWLGIITLTTLITIALRAWRWIVLMRPFTTSVTVWDASLALAVCYGANFFLPRSGEALRVVSLKWRHSLSTGSTAATVVVERIIDLVWLIVLFAVAVVLLQGRIEAAFPKWEPFMGPFIVAALAACIGLLALLSVISIYRDRALDVVGRILRPLPAKLSKPIVDTLSTFSHGLEALHTPSAYLEILLISLLLNAGYILIIYESFVAFGFDITYNLGPLESLVVMAVSSIGMVVPVPGGTGTYHVMFSRALLLLFSVPLTAALACATAVHALANLLYVGLAVPALLLLRRQRDQHDQRGEKQEAHGGA